jgi:hypothetical protein
MISPSVKRTFSFYKGADISNASIRCSEGLHIGQPQQYAARDQQHTGHNQLFHRIGIGPKGVEYHHTELAVLGNGYFVILFPFQ